MKKSDKEKVDLERAAAAGDAETELLGLSSNLLAAISDRHNPVASGTIQASATLLRRVFVSNAVRHEILARDSVGTAGGNFLLTDASIIRSAALPLMAARTRMCEVWLALDAPIQPLMFALTQQ